MGIPNKNWKKELRLPSERGTSKHIMDELLAQLEAYGWPQSDVFAIHLAAEEAITNAAVHGNKLDDSKTIHVVCHVTPDFVQIEVADEGSGFDPHMVPDCTCDTRLDAPNGRGVKLMKSFMTHLEYNTKGNRVLMKKHRDAAVQ